MKIKNIDDKFFLYAILFSLSNRIQTLGDNIFEDMTIKQHFFLICLSVFDKPPTLKQLSDVMGCSYQNVKNIARNLENKEFINFISDEKDKRKVLVKSSCKFENNSSKYDKVINNFMKNLYKDISMEEIKNTLKILIKMDNNIGGDVK